MLDQVLIGIICVVMAILAWVYVPGWIEENHIREADEGE